MSFWKHNPSSSPQIEAILSKEDLTLNELFDQDCLFQELKSSNKALIDFITRNDILAELVRLVTEEPTSDKDYNERYKFANLACEVLTTDTPTINEKLSDKTHLSKLYSFLEADPPLNPLLASFFSRTFSMLICRKHDQFWYSYQYTCLQVLDFLKSQAKSLDLLLKHLGTSAIMELTLKLLTQVEGADLQNTLINLLENECLIDNLMALFDPSVDEDRHHNVASLLCETIYKAKDDLNNSGENGGKRRDTNPILDKIQSVSMVDKLLKNCFGENVSESSIVGGISVLLALLCPPPSTNMNRRGCSDEMASSSGDSLQGISSQINLLPILSAILPYLPRLHQLLVNPPKREAIKLACGTVDPPLGQARLSIVKLLATLISTNTPEINDKLDELNSVQILLDLFFQYTWNNFLHAQVEKCLALALNSSTIESAQSNPLLPNIFVKCRILQRILSAWEENESEQAKGNRRRGYMGHLINIANNIRTHCEKEGLQRFLSENVDSQVLENWNKFVTETLDSINKIHSSYLGGYHPAQVTDDEEINMKGTFDMQEPLIKLQTSEDTDFTQSSDSNTIFRSYSDSMQEADFSTLFENFIPGFDHNVYFREEDKKKMLKELLEDPPAIWEDMLDYNRSASNPPCNSSDEELDDDEDTVVWSMSSTGGLNDNSNPWDSEACDNTELSEGWAHFRSGFPQEFPSDPIQFTDQQPVSPVHTDEVERVGKSFSDDEDCDPPREFEYEDSVEPDDESFQPAQTSVEPELSKDTSKVVVPGSEIATKGTDPQATEPSPPSVEQAKNSSVTPITCSTEPSQDSSSSPSDLSKSDKDPANRDSGISPIKSVESGDNISTPIPPSLSQSSEEEVNSRLIAKPGSLDDSSVKKTSNEETEKENKVPENSGKAAAEVGDTKNEEKKVEDPI